MKEFLRDASLVLGVVSLSICVVGCGGGDGDPTTGGSNVPITVNGTCANEACTEIKAGTTACSVVPDGGCDMTATPNCTAADPSAPACSCHTGTGSNNEGDEMNCVCNTRAVNV